MKTLCLAAFLSLSLSTTTFALTEKTITVEGPVEVVTSSTTPNTVIYQIEDPQHVKYQVVLPEEERIRLASIIQREPSSVIRFDGTVVDNESGRSVRVNKWNTITKTTTVTDDQGNTKITEQKTTSVNK